MKYIMIKVYLTSFTVVFLEILKKSSEKKSSENDQFTGHSQFFFYLFLFVPPTLNLKKNPVNQIIKKIWPKSINRICIRNVLYITGMNRFTFNAIEKTLTANVYFQHSCKRIFFCLLNLL